MFTCEFCGKEFSTQKELNNHLKVEHKTEIFIQKARKIHGDKYDYSKVEYINSRTPILIICPIHGQFYQLPKKHLLGQGCKECGYERLSKNK